MSHAWQAGKFALACWYKDEIHGSRCERIADTEFSSPPGVVMVLEVENQGFFDAKNRIGIKIRTLSVKIMGGYTRVPGGAYDEVKVRRPEIVAARQVEKAPDRAVFWDRVIAGAGRAEPVAAVVIGMKNAPQVHFWLDFRLLNIIEAVLVRHPDIKGGAGDGAAVGVGDASRNRKRHSLAIQRYIVAEGALGRRGHMEWAEHGRLQSRQRAFCC